MQSHESAVFCLERSSGKTVWTTALASRMEQDRGSGPRGTPTLDGDRLYVLAENGELACLRAQDGAKVWRRNILHEFNGQNPNWLLSESPLIDGDHVIVTPGGPGATIVALDKASGKTIWTSQDLSDRAAYSSCIIADVQGVRTIMALTAQAGVGVRAADGKLMWRYERVANRTANIATPVFHDNKVFYTSAYDTGCALLGLTAQNGIVKADEIYFSRELQNHHGGVVFLNGFLYGYSNSILTCLEFNDGPCGVEGSQRRQRQACGSLMAMSTCSARTMSPVWLMPRPALTARKAASPFPIRAGLAGRIQWCAVVSFTFRNQGWLACYAASSRETACLFGTASTLEVSSETLVGA